jgi:hypothetical protein
MQRDAKQQASATRDSNSSLMTFLSKPENVRRAYEQLTPRQKEIARFLDAVQQNRRMPILDPVDRLMAIRAVEPVLEDVPTYALGECYKRALKAHAHDGPFQSGEVVRCWREMSESTKTELLLASTGDRLLTTNQKCGFCNGSGIVYRGLDGMICTWDERGRGANVSRCRHDYPDTVRG